MFHAVSRVSRGLPCPRQQVQDFYAATLEAFPPGAVALVTGDSAISVLRWLQLTGSRPDVVPLRFAKLEPFYWPFYTAFEEIYEVHSAKYSSMRIKTCLMVG